jgi:hypothetical protein
VVDIQPGQAYELGADDEPARTVFVRSSGGSLVVFGQYVNVNSTGIEQVFADTSRVGHLETRGTHWNMSFNFPIADLPLGWSLYSSIPISIPPRANIPSFAGGFWYVRIPYPIVIPLLVSPWAIAKARATRRLRRLRRQLCPNCGYDLRASPDRCPECGEIPAPQQ